ncbi:hypothetical protein Toce_1075 [Thermosediminibacter oceani DSM 16646]|uniref:Uncharacterized protein n=1 Tax=Thermosediminibacter oceani (strain ATCC BAA-1034 / DSM 16646 / JW/IW-1228P) TaxID=555079 RepID=D9S359_THEOJ|nr:hypothetical protein Toce_1075 [Thermosediminibacter oceani DSM 16646]
MAQPFFKTPFYLTDLFIKDFEMTFDSLVSRVDRLTPLENALILRVMADYLILRNNNEMLEMGLFEPFEAINLTNYMNRIFNKYDEITNISVSSTNRRYPRRDRKERINQRIGGSFYRLSNCGWLNRMVIVGFK